jgi:hypothetical protein
VFENRMLRRIFGPKRDEVIGGLQNIIRMTKSRSMRCAGHVARMREKRNSYRNLVGKP